jgi:signal peptidase I
MNLPPFARRLVRHLWREWIRPLAVPLVVVAAAKSSLADINYVPSGSMMPTILPGDVVFIDKLAYDLRVPFTFARVARWSDPGRGDVVVCYSPDDGMRLVKRVVGVPGDRIELRGDILWVNGVRQNYGPLGAALADDIARAIGPAAVLAREQLGARPHAVMALPGRPALRDFGPVTVPAGSYLMLGDNRDNSRDSRYFGFVTRRAITGEVKGVFVSADLDRWLRPRIGRFFSRVDRL